MSKRTDTLANALTIRDILPWIGLVLLFISLPYLIGWIIAPPEQLFTASIVNASDNSVYLSAIRQGREGAWLFHYTYSPEPIAPAFIYFPYLAMGHLFSPFAISTTAVFILMRLMGSVLALFSFLYWVRIVFPHHRRMQLTTWLLIVFSGGLGWLATILLQTPFTLFPDLVGPEWGTLYIMMSAPHFSFGLATQTLFFTTVLQMTRGENGRFSFIPPAIFAVLLGLFYPFNLTVISVVLAVYVLVRTIQAKRILWKDWMNGIMIAIAISPLLFYYAVWIQRDANWKLTHSSHNVIAPPAPLYILIGLGILALLALAGGYHWIKNRRDPLALIWGVLALILIYVPVPYSGRFMMGLIVPIGTLAGFGLETAVLPMLSRKKIYTILEKISPTPYDTIRRLILILTIPSTIMAISLLSQVPILSANYPMYLPQADAKAADWFAENSNPETLVMSNHEMGNYLSRVAGNPVFIGHAFLTIDIEGKLEQTTEFWEADTSLAWREAFIEEWGIHYIYYGTYEKMIADGETIPLPGEIVYEEDGILIYDVHNR